MRRRRRWGKKRRRRNISETELWKDELKDGQYTEMER